MKILSNIRAPIKIKVKYLAMTNFSNIDIKEDKDYVSDCKTEIFRVIMQELKFQNMNIL